jgi:CRP/FNR family cyclic AMP-dependent transcriptional regulator
MHPPARVPIAPTGAGIVATFAATGFIKNNMMNKRILVIEDNKEVRENIAEILELSDYGVVTADNGKTGVEAALKEPFDLVVCDIMMPQLDGYGVLHLLSKRRETRNIPFIFLTAKSEKADFRKGMEMGADDYLTKPFDGIDLLNAIEIRLKKSEESTQKILPGAEGIDDFIKQAGRSGLVRLTSDQREVGDYKKKHVLYTEGQRPRVLYYIIKGRVKVYRINQDGKELITHIFSEGDFWGYNHILENINYRENAEVLEDASLMMIPAADFLELVTSDSRVAQQFIRLISRNVLEKEEDLLNLAYSSLRKKVAYGLIQQVAVFRRPGEALTTLNLSRKDMAQATGVATESFIRTVADFKEERLIDILDGKIVILDETKLRDLPN